MGDHTLPASGDWIMIKRYLPTRIQVPLLSMFYALPDRLFPSDWHSTTPWTSPQPRGLAYSAEQLSVLWRRRNRGRLRGDEIALAEKMDAEGISLDMRVRILTPDGEVCVEPYEWVPVGDLAPILDFIDDEHVILHELGGFKQSGAKDQVFYMQSRGISKSEAYRLLMGKVKRWDAFWIEVNEAYANILLPAEQHRVGRAA